MAASSPAGAAAPPDGPSSDGSLTGPAGSVGGGNAGGGSQTTSAGPASAATPERAIAELRKENEALRLALAQAGFADGAALEDPMVVAQEVAGLRQQVEAMRLMLPILTIPNFTFSLIPSASDGTGGKEVATYEILVNYGENVYAVYRRYSEFRSLHEKLEQQFKDKELLPRFPGRQGFFRSTNNNRAAIERRRRELQTYVRQLVASDEVRNCQLVKGFFAQLALDPSGGDGYEASIASDEGETPRPSARLPSGAAGAPRTHH